MSLWVTYATRAVGTQAEVAQAHRLVAVDHERREGEQDLAGQLRLRLLLEVVGPRVRLLEEPLEVRRGARRARARGTRAPASRWAACRPRARARWS